MENTLFSGDKILVSKLKYGPRIPNSPFEIPWFKLFFFHTGNAQERLDKPLLNHRRLNGLDKVERQDVLVFNHVDNTNDHLIKRCIGLPGDTIAIRNCEVYINRRKTIDPKKVKLRYNVWYNDRKETMDFLNNLGIMYNQTFVRSKAKSFEMSLDHEQVLHFKDKYFIDSMGIKTAQNKVCNLSKAFTWDVNNLWTTENFGPLVIPKKGMRVILDESNIAFYSKVIRKYDSDVECMNEIAYAIQNNDGMEYTFRNNFYFMMGDNRNNSSDSRFWGLLPEDHIIGNAVIVLFSTDIRNTKLLRLLKKTE